jgi:hypothetical protein
MTGHDHPRGVETRELVSGHQGVAHHGEGRVTKVWRPTEMAARRAAAERLEAEQ